MILSGDDGGMMLLTVALIPSQSGEDGAMKWFCLLLMSAALSAGEPPTGR